VAVNVNHVIKPNPRLITDLADRLEPVAVGISVV
jgi:hypothetical protein